MKATISEAPKGSGIGLMFVGADRGRGAWGHDAPDQLLNALAGRLGVWTSVSPLEQGPLRLLRGPHRAAPAQLGVAHAVDEVRGSDEQVQVEGPVLAVLEGPEAVEHERLIGCPFGADLFMKEQAVAAEALHLSLNGAVGDAELAADLTQTGAADEAMEEGFEKTRMSQPIAGREGL